MYVTPLEKTPLFSLDTWHIKISTHIDRKLGPKFYTQILYGYSRNIITRRIWGGGVGKYDRQGSPGSSAVVKVPGWGSAVWSRSIKTTSRSSRSSIVERWLSVASRIGFVLTSSVVTEIHT